MSPSLRGRGLKYCETQPLTSGAEVALFTRAWIEIMSLEKATDLTVVALFTRAWIEIINGTVIIGRTWSPSLRGRGLKYNLGFEMSFLLPCRPLYEGVD